MCGIFAMFLRRPLSERDIARGRAGTATLTHRGPDSGGEWFNREQGVFIGHRRLAIIDLAERANQPMVRDRIVVAFNGEIYNFRSIRAKLEGTGAVFSTKSDTEVLVRAWQRWGSHCLGQFDAMLACVLWDGVAGWLALDRFGEKQLYYSETADGVIISSELPPLVQVLNVTADDPAAWTMSALVLGYIAGPQTAAKGVRRMSPASVLRIERGRTTTASRYWQVPIGTPGRGSPRPFQAKEVRRVHDALATSLEARLEADVPLCVFLSSGVDSALVAALARRQFQLSPQCYTVDFGPGTAAEISGAQRIAGALQLPHRVLDGTGPANVATPQGILDFYGQPNDNLTIVSVRQMVAAARAEGFRVGLTGMGGDEMFFGYNKHSFFFRHRRTFALPEWARLGMGFLARPFRRSHSTVRAFLDTAAVHDYERFLAVKNLSAIHWLRRLPGFDAWAQREFGSWRERLEIATPRFDLEHTMPDSLLTAQDLGSMRAGVELRTPFISRHVADALAELDPRALLAFGQKGLLRRILEPYLPAGTLRADKQGFIFPQDVFLAATRETPVAAGVPAAWASSIWARRAEPGLRELAVRLLLVAEFAPWMARASTVAAGPPGNAVIAGGR